MGLFDGSIGAFVIGTVLSTFLLGVTSCQAYGQPIARPSVGPPLPEHIQLTTRFCSNGAGYFMNFPRDKRLYWWMVVFLCLMDWAHTAMSVYTVSSRHSLSCRRDLSPPYQVLTLRRLMYSVSADLPVGRDVLHEPAEADRLPVVVRAGASHDRRVAADLFHTVRLPSSCVC